MAKDGKEPVPRDNEGKPAKTITALERLIAQSLGQGRTFGSEEDEAKDRYPNVWAWMSTAYLPNNRVQNPATLTINLGPDGCVGTINHRDQAVSITAGSKTLEGIFEALEAALSGPNPPLRFHGSREPKTRKRNLDK